MENIVFLLSKDCMSCESVPVYKNKIFSTPNINELAQNGSVFTNHYTAASSTSMSMSAMLTGHYPYEFKSRKKYEAALPGEFDSIFNYYQDNGYETHVIWDKLWVDMAYKYVRCFGNEDKVTFHNLDIAQHTSATYRKRIADIQRDDNLLDDTYKQIYNTLDNIDLKKKQFIWLHLPHILKGRTCYMDDMDAFDNIVGYIRGLVGDDSIYLTTDHGHMNMHKGIVGYGFHVYQPIVKIPLITPRIDGIKEYQGLTSNINLPDIMIKNKIPNNEYVVLDTAYYGQRHRVTGITDGRFKYIYNKKNKSEELYDLIWDEDENYNILKEEYYDRDRGTYIKYRELYFYPYHTEAMLAYKKLKDIKSSMWEEESWFYEMYGVLRTKLGAIKRRLKMR